MTVDQSASAWESMLNDANDTAPAVPRRRAARNSAIVVLRTTALLIVAALAILVLLPAALTAQSALAG
jgi:hypothetical protein